MSEMAITIDPGAGANPPGDAPKAPAPFWRGLARNVSSGLALLPRTGWRGLLLYHLYFFGMLAAAAILWAPVLYGIRWLFVSEAARIVLAIVQPAFWFVIVAGLWRTALHALREQALTWRTIYSGLPVVHWIWAYVALITAGPFFTLRIYDYAAFFLQMPAVARVGSILLAAALITALFYTAFTLPLIADRRGGLFGAIKGSYRIVRGRELSFLVACGLCAAVAIIPGYLHPLAGALALPLAVLTLAGFYEAWREV